MHAMLYCVSALHNSLLDIRVLKMVKTAGLPKYNRNAGKYIGIHIMKCLDLLVSDILGTLQSMLLAVLVRNM